MAKQVPVLGVDFGGVLCSRFTEDAAGYADYPPIDGAFEALKKLEGGFGKNIFIVSRASIDLRFHILKWLGAHHFCKATGISFDRVHFCERRKEKVEICQEREITHFIDDRTEVLEHLLKAGVKHLYLFQGRPDEMEERTHVLPKLRQVASWEEVLVELLH